MQDKIEKSSLRTMFWKDEILQVLYWMYGEGLELKISVDDLLPFLNTNRANLNYHLNKLTKSGYLEKDHNADEEAAYYWLTETGKKEAAPRFKEAFQGMQNAGHGECGPDCEYCYGPDGEKLENCVHNCGQQE